MSSVKYLTFSWLLNSDKSNFNMVISWSLVKYITPHFHGLQITIKLVFYE